MAAISGTGTMIQSENWCYPLSRESPRLHRRLSMEPEHVRVTLINYREAFLARLRQLPAGQRTRTKPLLLFVLGVALWAMVLSNLPASAQSTFQGLGHLGGGTSSAADVSADSLVVVGTSHNG